MCVCRLCLTNSSEEHYSLNYGLPDINDKLQLCVPEMEEVHLLNAKICPLCYDHLNVAYAFRQKCLISLQVIKDISFNSSNSIDDCILSINTNKNKDVNDDDKNNIVDRSATIKNSEVIVIIDDDNEIKKEPKEEFDEPVLPRYGLPKIEEIPQIKEEAIEEILPDTPNNAIASSANRDLLCKICFRQYSNKTCFYRHLKVTHNIQKKKPDNEQMPKRLNQLLKLLPSNEHTLIQNELLTPCEQTVCKKCDITLNCEHELKYHNALSHLGLSVSNVHFLIFCNKCKCRFSHKYLNEHLVSHDYKVEIEDIFKAVDVPKDGPFVIVKFWKCDICDKFFDTPKESLDHHFLNHKTAVD